MHATAPVRTLRCCAALLAALISFQARAADPVLAITATPDPAVIGSPLGLDVTISGITDLYAFQYSLSFDPSLLQAVGVAEGSFLAQGGATFFDGGMVDNAAGTITLTYDSLIGALPGVTGSGVLAHIDFAVVGTGSTPLTFADAMFLDSGLGNIGVLVQDRVLHAVPEPAAAALFAFGIAGLLALRRRSA